MHWSAQKDGDRTEELKVITSVLVQRLNLFFTMIH